METIRVPARIEFWDSVYGMIRSALLPWGCEEQILEQIEIAVEELFTNIVSYGYVKNSENEQKTSPKGEVVVEAEVSGDPPKATVRLIDWGVSFNPLKKADPDFQIPFDERPIGGLGIYMVKKFMDQAEYERRGDCNVITVEKQLK